MASRLFQSGVPEKRHFRVNSISSVKREQRVLFRVDAGLGVGLGHLQRCLSLATALALQGHASHFVIRENGATIDRIRASGFGASEVPRDSKPETDLSFTLSYLERDKADVVVVDCRAVNAEYLWELRKSGCFVVTIDDLAKFIFTSHLVVNGNIYAERLSYCSATGDTRFLLGTNYVMLRPEFWRVEPRLIGDEVRRILVTLGGIDQGNLMAKILGLLDDLPGDFAVTAIIGPFLENSSEAERASRHSRHQIELIYAPGLMRDFMLEADLAISGGGQTLYELARVGCPTVAVQVASDQGQHLRALDEAGIIRTGRCSNGGELTEVGSAVLALLADGAARVAMSAAGQRLVDGQGAIRVARVLLREARLS